MARVRQKGSGAELAVGRTLRAAGIAYRKNVRGLPGSPDFANRRRRWAVFVNGCFWHHHKGCPRATTPTRNRSFWTEKFAANRARDARKVRGLWKAGFKVLIVWECETADCADRLSKVLKPRGVELP